MDKLGEKAFEYLTAFEELAKQYAPDVIEAGLTVVQVNGLQKILVGFVLLGLALVCVRIIKWGADMKKRGAEMKKNHAPGDYAYIDLEVNGEVLAILGGIGCVLVGFFSSIFLLSVWNWIALFNPKLYIAYKLFEKVL